MSQIKQIVCAASAAVAFGTIVNVQATPASLAARGAAIDRDDTIGQFKLLAKAGNGEDNRSQTLWREDAPHTESAIGKDWLWFAVAPYHGQSDAGMNSLASCAAYPTCADKLLDNAYRAPAPGLTAFRKFDENFSNAWSGPQAA